MISDKIFNYESYINFDKTPFIVESDENGNGYNIVVGFMVADLKSPFDKACKAILKNLKFHINPRVVRNKWEVVDYGKFGSPSNMTDMERAKFEILARQMPNFFKKYKEATPKQFVLFVRNLLRPMRDSHCRYNLKDVSKNLFENV